MFLNFLNNVGERFKENLWTDSSQNIQLSLEDLPPEIAFRGFEKAPRVLCERIDISSYLGKQKSKKNILKTKSSFAKPDFSMYFQQCSVRLVREDLENLRILYSKNNNNSKKSLNNINTSSSKCKYCEKVYNSDKRLQNHVQSKHQVVYKTEIKPIKRVSFSDQVIVHELKEYHHCRKCPKIYEDYRSLKIHMKQAHRKRKCYICFYCNKDFVDRMFFKVHIKMHCNLCGKFFNSKKLHNDHRRTVCRILKRYPCKVCNEIYFSFLSRKDHSYSHEGGIFVCDICKESFNSKCPLLHHIQFLHCKKRPKSLYDMVHVGTDIMYECNSCDQCSNNKDVMENHTTSLPDLKDSIRTGYKDYCFCDQCSKQFDTETKMLRHKWTHFLKADNNDDGDHADTEKNKFKMIYKLGEKLPLLLQPKIVLPKVKFNVNENERTSTENIETSTSTKTSTHTTTENIIMSNNNNNQEIIVIPDNDDDDNDKGLINGVPKKPIVDPVSKKTILSKYQCEYCHLFYSRSSTLRRHIQTIHLKNNIVQCFECEELFASPALLKFHNCIRMHIPEMPFQDARPEIEFDNLHDFYPNITMNTSLSQGDVDFEIPAPIVELTEYENCCLVVNNEGSVSMNNVKTIADMKYKITLQEVPIEF